MKERNSMNTKPDNPDALLDAHFAALRTEMAGHDAPRCVEKELMQAFTRQFAQQRPWYRRWSLPHWGAACAFASVAAAILLLVLAPQRLVTVGPALVGFDDGAAFIALESLERIAREPDARLVEADLPQSALAPLGVPVDPQNADGTVRAEMLLAADGHPLALRLSASN
jgi:hypothetical protein